MITLKDVAKEAGLTVSTVSRILNNRGYISEKSRDKVYAAMKSLNYQPNEVARSLSKKTTNTIGVIVPHIRHPYFSELISNIEYYAHKKQYKILLFNSRGESERETEYIEMCTSNRVAGIIICSGTVEVQKFEGLHVPLITIERYLENGTATIECDNKQGGILATNHLIEKGCKNLIHISGIHETHMPADSRAHSFVEVCKEHGVKYQVIETQSYDYNSLEYREFLKNVLEEHNEVDGIFASSDLIAAQLLQICSKMNIKIPEEIKIIGFDDVIISSLTTPMITTIHQPIKEMAQQAVEILISANAGKIVPSRTTLPVSIIQRETT